MLIVDLTDIARHANQYVLASGIPRLVAAISQELQRLYKGHDKLAFGYYSNVINSYVLIEPGYTFEARDIKTKISYGISSRTFRPERYKNKPGRYAFHRIKYYARTCAQHLSLIMSGGLPSHLRKYKFQVGDHLLLLGAGWNADQLISHLADQHVIRNFDITILVHDLIHTLLPDVEGRVMLEVFEAWLKRALQLRANILCYSQNTRRDVLRFCASNGIPAPRTHVIPLVHELRRLDPGPIRHEVAQLMKQEYVLFVGPLPGRKNGLMLMRFWKRLADELGSQNIPQLVIAGASGPEDVPDSHFYALTPQVTFIRRPNDDELAALYQHTAFSVFLSMYEGWGLPVGESLWHGKTCLAADNSSLREVGGPFCQYVDLDDTEEVFAKLRQMVSNKSYIAALNSQIDQSKLRTWRDVARDLISFCNKQDTTNTNASELVFEPASKNSPHCSSYQSATTV